LDPKLFVQVAAAAAAMMKEWWLFVPIFNLFIQVYFFIYTIHY